jgi:hypothetical protein
MIDDMLYDASLAKAQPTRTEPLPQRGQGAPEVLMASAGEPPAPPSVPIPSHSPAAWPEGTPTTPPPTPAAPEVPAAGAPIPRDAPRPHEPQPLMAPRKTKAEPVVVPVPPRPGGPRRRSELAG